MASMAFLPSSLSFLVCIRALWCSLALQEENYITVKTLDVKQKSIPESGQMGVVRGSWVADRSFATGIQMTEEVGQLLEVIGVKIVVIK